MDCRSERYLSTCRCGNDSLTSTLNTPRLVAYNIQTVPKHTMNSILNGPLQEAFYSSLYNIIIGIAVNIYETKTMFLSYLLLSHYKVFADQLPDTCYLKISCVNTSAI